MPIRADPSRSAPIRINPRRSAPIRANPRQSAPILVYPRLSESIRRPTFDFPNVRNGKRIPRMFSLG
jgi:hypothetical protein